MDESCIDPDGPWPLTALAFEADEGIELESVFEWKKPAITSPIDFLVLFSLFAGCAPPIALFYAPWLVELVVFSEELLAGTFMYSETLGSEPEEAEELRPF